MRLRVARQAGSSREVLPQQQIPPRPRDFAGILRRFDKVPLQASQRVMDYDSTAFRRITIRYERYASSVVGQRRMGPTSSCASRTMPGLDPPNMTVLGVSDDPAGNCNQNRGVFLRGSERDFVDAGLFGIES